MVHVVDKCYKLHGYPPSYKFKFAKGQVSTTLPPFTNNVIASEDDTSEGVSLTKSEYQQLLGLLNSNCHFGTQGLLREPQIPIRLQTSSLSLHLIFKGMRYQVYDLLLPLTTQFFLHPSILLIFSPLIGFLIVEPLTI